MQSIVLFEVSRVLVRNPKDVSGYVSESIRNMYGYIIPVQLERYEGMSSQETVEAILRENGVKQEEIDPRLQRYMIDLYYTYYNVAGHDKHTASEGAEELLRELEEKGAAVGIASGDAERVARLKLEKSGLAKYFTFGAYGDSIKDMREIIKTAADNGKGIGSGPANVVLVAGTQIQVKAAKSLGFRAIGVSSGSFSEKELYDAGADLVVRSLKEKGKISKLVFG